jgi:hypothetical protein
MSGGPLLKRHAPLYFFWRKIMQKSIVFFAVLTLLLFSFTPGAQSANPASDLVILYTGDTIGRVEPCG